MPAHAAAVTWRGGGVHLVVGECPSQVLVQRPKRAVAVDFGEQAVVMNDVAVANHGTHTAGLGALQDHVEQRRLGFDALRARSRDCPVNAI